MDASFYYARAIDSSILVALNKISQAQTAPTFHTLRLCYHLFDYCATYPNTRIRFHASNMFLHVDSDAAYLDGSTDKSRVAGYFQLVHQHPFPTNFVNGIIFVDCKTLKHVAASSAESETAAAFHNSQFPYQYVICSALWVIYKTPHHFD